MKILKSYYLENGCGCVQLVQDGETYLVGCTYLVGLYDPNWGYSVRYFSSLEEADDAYEELYAIDRSWGNAI